MRPCLVSNEVIERTSEPEALLEVTPRRRPNCCKLHQASSIHPSSRLRRISQENFRSSLAQSGPRGTQTFQALNPYSITLIPCRIAMQSKEVASKYRQDKCDMCCVYAIILNYERFIRRLALQASIISSPDV